MIAGVDGRPLDHASTIVGVCKRRGLPLQAAVIALMTGITESGLKVLANPDDPNSMSFANDGVGYDHDSLGIFQQRPNWGSVAQRMDPAASAGLFLDRMVGVADWVAGVPWQVAQDVQVSAYDGTPRQANNWTAEYGGNYHANYDQARELATGLWNVGHAIAPPKENPVKPYLVRDGSGQWWVIDPACASKTRVTPAAAKSLAATKQYLGNPGFDQTTLATIPEAK